MVWELDAVSGSYILRNGKITLLRTKFPAVLFDSATGKIWKQGEASRVLKYLTQMRCDFVRVNDLPKAGALCLVSSSEFGIDELNKLISVRGYAKTFFKTINKQ